MNLKDYDSSRKEIVYFITLSTPDLIKNFTHHGIATLVASQLEFRFASEEITLFGYCILSDHAHIFFSLGRSCDRNLHTWVSTFQRHTEKMVKEIIHIRSLWQEEFHDHLLRREESLLKIAQYVISNPAGKAIGGERGEHPYCRLVDSYQKKR